MRIRIVQKPSPSRIDGIQLDHYVPGREYELGSSLANLFLAEGWAEPVALDEPPDEPRLDDPHARPDPPHPGNLVREIFPPYYVGPAALVADRRRRRRTKTPR